MGKIKVNTVSQIEEELESLGFMKAQARVMGAVMRGIAGDVMNKRKSDTIVFQAYGERYRLTLEKED